MAVNIATLAIKFVADTSGIKQGVSSVVSNVLTGAAAFIGINKAIAAFSAGAERVDKMAKAADKFGTSVRTMQNFGLAAKLSNVDMETLGAAIDHMSKKIGSGGMALDKRFLEQAEAIAAIKDPAEQARKAYEVFGKQAGKMFPLFKGGAAAIKEASDLITRFDLGLSDIDAKNVERMNDSWTKLGAIMEGTIDKLTAEMAPALGAFLDHTIEQLAELGTGWRDWGDIMTAEFAELANLMDLAKGMMFGAKGAGEALIGDGGPLAGFSSFIEGKKALDRFFAGTSGMEIRDEAEARRLGKGGPDKLGRFGGIETKFAPGSANRDSQAAAKIINAAGGSMASQAEKDAAATAANTKAMREGIDRIANVFKGELPVLAVGNA